MQITSIIILKNIYELNLHEILRKKNDHRQKYGCVNCTVHSILIIIFQDIA